MGYVPLDPRDALRGVTREKIREGELSVNVLLVVLLVNGIV